MELPARTLEDLSFPTLLAALASRCVTAVGRERALSRPFLDTAEEVELAQTRIDEARALLSSDFALPLGASPDIRPHLERAVKRGLLEPRELLAVSQVLFGLSRTRDALISREETAAELGRLGRRLPALDALAHRLDGAIEGEGELSDRASPALREARERVRGLHRRIMGRLDGLLHDEGFAQSLRESYYSVRNGRYVVPVNAQHQAQIPGIVHNASQTGQTLFVEPQALVGLGNELAIAQSLVLEEERRILQALTSAIGERAEEIRAGAWGLGELDEIFAAAELAARLSATRPRLEPQGGALELRALRHPVLALGEGEVVPNDVLLSGDLRALVVSGPNAGGKTVTLTGVGLCALMVRAGLPIPVAEGSRLPLYRSVHAAIGDAQDLSLGLSTFSAHLVELREIRAAAGPGALVLIDEIASDTDPREGAALAVAVLEDLLERGVQVLVTTHLEELKALAHMDARFVNARVGFDSKRMAPTYRLTMGSAGASSAIEIARRMGLPAPICDRARELMHGAGGPLARALAAAEEERSRLAEQLEAARAAEASARTRAAELERARLEAERIRGEELREHHRTMAAELERTREELAAWVSSLQAERSAEKAQAARQQLEERARSEREAAGEAEAGVLRAQAPEGELALRPGGWVHHAGMGRDVEVLEVQGGEVLVAAGSLKLRAPISQLAPAVGKRPKKAFPDAPSARRDKALERAEAAGAGAVHSLGARCDVRGMRAEEALRQMERALDQALRAGEPEARVVHGHGTGALRQAVREYLAGSPYVERFRAGESHEGGDGVTVAILRS